MVNVVLKNLLSNNKLVIEKIPSLVSGLCDLADLNSVPFSRIRGSASADNPLGDRFLSKYITFATIIEGLIKRQAHPRLRAVSSKMFNKILKNNSPTTPGVADPNAVNELFVWTTLHAPEAMGLIFGYAVLIDLVSQGETWMNFATPRTRPGQHTNTSILHGLGASTTIDSLGLYITRPKELYKALKNGKYRVPIVSKTSVRVLEEEVMYHDLLTSTNTDWIGPNLGLDTDALSLMDKIEQTSRLTTNCSIEYILQETIHSLLTYKTISDYQVSDVSAYGPDRSKKDVLQSIYQSLLSKSIVRVLKESKLKAQKEKRYKDFVEAIAYSDLSAQYVYENSADRLAIEDDPEYIKKTSPDFFLVRKTGDSRDINPIYDIPDSEKKDLVTYSILEFIPTYFDVHRLDLLEKGIVLLPSIGDNSIGASQASTVQRFEVIWAPGFIPDATDPKSAVIALAELQLANLGSGRLVSWTVLSTQVLKMASDILTKHYSWSSGSTHSNLVVEFAHILGESQRLGGISQWEEKLNSKIGWNSDTFMILFKKNFDVLIPTTTMLQKEKLAKRKIKGILDFLHSMLVNKQGKTRSTKLLNLLFDIFESESAPKTRSSEELSRMIIDCQLDEIHLHPLLTLISTIQYEVVAKITERRQSRLFRIDDKPSQARDIFKDPSIYENLNNLDAYLNFIKVLIIKENTGDSNSMVTQFQCVWAQLTAILNIAADVNFSSYANLFSDYGYRFSDVKTGQIVNTAPRMHFIRQTDKYFKSHASGEDALQSDLYGNAFNLASRFLDSVHYELEKEEVGQTIRIVSEKENQTAQFRLASVGYETQIFSNYLQYCNVPETQDRQIDYPLRKIVSDTLRPGCYSTVINHDESTTINLAEVDLSLVLEEEDFVFQSFILFSIS